MSKHKNETKKYTTLPSKIRNNVIIIWILYSSFISNKGLLFFSNKLATEIFLVIVLFKICSISYELALVKQFSVILFPYISLQIKFLNFNWVISGIKGTKSLLILPKVK